MSVDAIESDAFLSDDLYFRYANWAVETGLWNGREVTWKEAVHFQKEIEQRILDFLSLENFSSFPAQLFAAQLAWIGAKEEDRTLLARDIQELRLTPNGIFLQASHHKSKISKFWKKHKKEILIGAAVVGGVTTGIVIAVCSFGTTTGGAVAAGAALGSLQEKDRHSKKGSSPQSPVPSKNGESTDVAAFTSSAFPFTPNQSPHLEKPASIPSLIDTSHKNPSPTPKPFNIPLPSTAPPLRINSGIACGQISYHERGIQIGERFFPYNEAAKWRSQHLNVPSSPNQTFLIRPPHKETNLNIPFCPSTETCSSETNSPSGLPNTEPNQPLISSIFEIMGRGLIDPDLLNPEIPLSKPPAPKYYETEGGKLPGLTIAGINGVNTSFEAMKSHAQYLKQFVPDQSVDWICNRSHGFFIDLLEVFFANYLGHSPNTSQALIEKWTAFHKLNISDPEAKVLQFCHSQGALHVRNALAKAPQQIQARVIVVAIAPATVVPADLCFKSFNYASKRDVVHLGELAVAGAWDTKEFGISKPHKMILNTREELILLDPHPEATGIDHDFQSPTFRDVIRRRISNYLENNGSYKLKEDCK